MTIGIIAAVIGLVLLFISARYYFSPKYKKAAPCRKLKEKALEAGERYERIRRRLVELINERNQLKEQVDELAGQKEKCDAEYQNQKAEFNAGGVTEASNNDDAWWEERERLRQKLHAKEEACKKITKELAEKRSRLHEIEGNLEQGRLMEELSRETYPEAWKAYRDCVREKVKQPTAVSDEANICCPSGYWMGIVAREGGELFVAGLESGVIYLLCLDNPDVTATLKWRGKRAGPGLGGGAGIEFIFLNGPQFPCKTEEAVSDVIGGLGFDLSAGPALADYLEGLAKSGSKLAQYLDDVSGAKAKFDKLQDALKGGDSGVKEGIKQQMAAGGMSSAGSGFTGVTIPISGAGVNIGLWYTFADTCELVSWSGCRPCDGQ